jgi:outer membrane protein
MKLSRYRRNAFLFLSVIVIFFFANTAFSASAVKIGVVDLDKILNESDKGKEAKQNLQKEIIKTQQELKKKEAEAKKIRDELNKKGSVLSETARKDKEAEYRRLAIEVQRFARDTEAEIKREGDELSQAMVKDISKIIEEYGKKENFSMILGSRAGLFYYAETIDLTDEILKIYNSKNKSPKKGKK